MVLFGECTCTPREIDGYTYVWWIGQYFGSCARTPVEITSVALGLTNILFWLFAQVPQFYETYKLKRAEALHPLFLITWLIGDITNLIGSFLTRQLPFQQYTAIYFCVMDILILSQWTYYKIFYKPQITEVPLLTPRLASALQHPKFSMLSFLLLLNLTVYGGIYLLSNTPIYPTSNSHISSSPLLDVSFTRKPNRQLLATQQNSSLPDCEKSPIPLVEWEIIFGDVCSWISAIFYLWARCPQIVRNWTRKTVAGVSVSMFSLTICANAFYGASILLRQPPIDDRFYRSVLPFLLGSLGTIGGSLVVIGQWFWYDYNRNDDDDDENVLINVRDIRET